MNKKRMVSVFCSFMMVLSMMFAGAPAVLAAPEAQKEDEKSHNTYLKGIKGVNLTINFTKFGTEFQAFDILSADTEKIDIEAEAEDPRASVEISGNENLESGYNRIAIKVTAENGINTREYGVTVYKRASDDLSSNADLKSISGLKLNEAFDKERLHYTAVVAADVLYLDQFSYETDHTEAYAHAGGVYQMLQVGENLVTINVTAQDGTAKEYTIVVTREGAQEQTSSNANLQGIYGLDLKETFDKDKTEYTASVSNETAYLYGLYAVAEDGLAAVSIENQNTELIVGENLIKIKVTAQNGDEKVYQINVTREEKKPLSSNADLKAITGITLNETFDKNHLEYTASVGRDVDRIEITAEAEDQDSYVAVYGNHYLSLGENIVNIMVYATDGTSKNYVLNINRGNVSSNTNIRAISGIELDNPFSNDVLSYYSLVPYEISALDLKVETEDPGAMVSVRGAVQSLKVGMNIIQVEVTAESGQSKVVNITVERAPSTEISSDASITKLYGGLIVNEQMKPDQLDYTAQWDGTYGSNTITIDANQYANIHVSGTSANGEGIIAWLESQYQGVTVFHVENMAKGENVLSLDVTAQNGDVKTYTIKVTK